MRSDHRWGVTIGLCFLQTAIVAVFTCCGDPNNQGSAYKVHKRVCPQGWRSVDTSPGLQEGSPHLTQSWGKQTLCLKVHHTAAIWRDARDSCRREHGALLNLDFPGFVSPNVVGIIQNLAREIWAEGLRRIWTGMFVEGDKLWWESKSPRPVYGKEPDHWWEWLEGQPGQRTGNFGRLDLKNGTNTMSPDMGSEQPFLWTHPSSVFRLGLTLVEGSTVLPYVCINNGFVLPPTQASKCPSGWYGSPYVDKCLWFSNHQAVSYTDARILCKEKGGQLAMPQDAFYNAYVTKVILNAELGVLRADDDPEVEEAGYGHSEVGGASRLRCVFCTNAQSIEKCQPSAELLNGSCSPDKICGVKVMKRSNGSLAYTGGCFPPSQCEVFGDLTLKHLCTTDEAAYTICCPDPTCLRRLLSIVAAFTCEPKFPMAVEGHLPSGADQEEVECFTCDGATSDEECIAKGTVVRCRREYPSMRVPVCQTRIWQESRHSRVRISKKCVSATLCEAGEQQECTTVSVSPSCVYCCQGYRCNQWLPDNPILMSPLSRRAWIGFRKQESNLHWVDGGVSTVARWNSTFGSVYPYLPDSGCGQLWADRPWGSEWLVGKCTTNLPFVCETSAHSTEVDVQIVVHPEDIIVRLSNLRSNNFFSDYDDQSDSDLTLTCGATDYHIRFPVVWVKDGRYYDNGSPSRGFMLDVTSEMLVTPGDSIYNLQGDYHCEVWDAQGQKRTSSMSARVRFEDVMTYQASIRIPSHAYNSTVHSMATLLFNPIYRTGLEHYRRMLYNLTQLRTPVENLIHHVTINAYRPGSLIIDFTLFYELPTLNTKKLYRLVNITQTDITTRPGETRSNFDEHFYRLVVENMKTKVTNKSSPWYTTYGSWGISPSDVTVLDTVACPMETTALQGRTIRWPRTLIGHVIHTKQICVQVNDGMPMGRRRCVGDFVSGARWEEPSYKDDCLEEESPITTKLRFLSDKEVNKTNADDILTEASSLISGTSRTVMADIVYATQILDGVASLSQIDVQSGKKAIGTASILMRMNKTLLENAQKVANSCNRISTAIEEIGRSVNLHDTPSTTFVERNIIVSVYDIVNDSTVVQGVGYHGNLANFTEKYFTLYDLNGQWTNQEPNLGVTLPQQLRDMVTNIKDGNRTHIVDRNKVRVTFTLFQRTDLFIGPNSNTNNTNSTTIDNTPLAPRSLHGAVSVDIRGLKVTHLTQPVLTTFTFQQDIREEDVACVFWDYLAANGSGDWSQTGCHVNKTERGRVTCACNHLTTFSVLIASQGNEASSLRVRKVAVTLSLLVGLSVSIAGLGLSVISFILFRSLRKTRSQQILFNIAVAALFCNIAFWIGLEPMITEHYCIVVAVLLHYFLLASFTWLLVEAILQFLQVVRLPELPAKYFTLKAAVAAWGFPGIVVGVICAVDFNLYSSQDNFCWLLGLPSYFGLILPVGVIFAVTMGVSFVVICRLLSKRMESIKCSEVPSSISIGHVFSNLVSFAALAATWVIAFYALDFVDGVMDSVFSVCNSLFGIYIFLLLHLREPSLRKKRRGCCCSCRIPKNKDSDSSTTSSVGTISSKIVPTLQKSPIHAERNIYVTCPSEKRDTVVGKV